MNDLTQARIALILSCFVLFGQEAVLLGFYYLSRPFNPFIFTIPLIFSLLLYGLVFWLIEKYILSKIKILYRTVLGLGGKNIPRNIQDPQLFEQLRLEMEKFNTAKESEVAQLKENEQYRKEFLGNVSHELKTPLFSIQGYSDILLDGGLEDENINRKYIQKIAKNTARLIDIVKDLILISQVESNQLKLHKERFFLYELCLSVVDSLEMMAQKKHTKIEFKNSKHLHYEVYADREKLFQVLHNIIENAIFYTPPHTKVSIRFFNLESHVLIEISDNGQGIEPEHLPRLFERFYRVDKDRNRKKGGSGLGLSIVKKILEAHGQSIQVRSEVGSGTTLSFTLEKP